MRILHKALEANGFADFGRFRRGSQQRDEVQGEALARAGGAREIVLWSDTRFERGHRFYEKLGFVREPVERYLADASESWEFFFRKSLG